MIRPRRILNAWRYTGRERSRGFSSSSRDWESGKMEWRGSLSRFVFFFLSFSPPPYFYESGKLSTYLPTYLERALDDVNR